MHLLKKKIHTYTHDVDATYFVFLLETFSLFCHAVERNFFFFFLDKRIFGVICAWERERQRSYRIFIAATKFRFIAPPRGYYVCVFVWEFQRTNSLGKLFQFVSGCLFFYPYTLLSFAFVHVTSSSSYSSQNARVCKNWEKCSPNICDWKVFSFFFFYRERKKM